MKPESQVFAGQYLNELKAGTISLFTRTRKCEFLIEIDTDLENNVVFYGFRDGSSIIVSSGRIEILDINGIVINGE